MTMGVGRGQGGNSPFPPGKTPSTHDKLIYFPYLTHLRLQPNLRICVCYKVSSKRAVDVDRWCDDVLPRSAYAPRDNDATAPPHKLVR